MTDQDPPRFVLYHAGCADGFGAAWAAWRALGDRATYLPVQYGEPLPPIPDGALVTIVDFSYPRDVLLALRDRSLALAVLDHHKSAAEDLAGLPFVTFDMEKSGCRLAWEFWHPHEEMPRLLAHIEDRDLWRFALGGTREISAWLASWPREFDRWSWGTAQLEEAEGQVCAEGAAILRAQAQHVEAMANHAGLIDLAGHRVPCANATLFQSDLGQALCARYPAAPFSATYFDAADGRRVWSLRTRRDDVDVSAVARGFGGGGHRAAAGFTTRSPEARDALRHGGGGASDRDPVA